MASRHLARSIAMQSLYEWDFYNFKADLEAIIEKNLQEFGQGLSDKAFVYELVKGVVEHLPEINNVIEKAAPQWPMEQISRINRNVLRLGLYELLYADESEVPPKVAINEAIELAKNFGSKTSGKFVNGVLGAIYKEMPKTENREPVQALKTEAHDFESRGKERQSRISEEALVSGVVFRQKNKDVEIALILDAFGYWTFPKGHIEDKETLEQALAREIKEEIGLDEIKIIKELGEREYIANGLEKKQVRKKVTDFLVEAIGKIEINPGESPGIKKAKWFSLPEIEKLKKYKDCQYALEDTIDFLGNKKIRIKDNE